MFRTVIKKEAKQLFADKGFLLIALIQPIVFILMFGSSFENGDINHLNTIVLDYDNSDYSQYVVEATENSEFFEVVERSESLEDNFLRLNNSDVRAIILIPEGFEERIRSRQVGRIEIYLDSSNFLTYSSLSGAQIEIARDTLIKVSSDLLNDLEESKGKFDDAQDIFLEIKVLAEEAENDFEFLKNETDRFDSVKVKGDIGTIQIDLKAQIKDLKDFKSVVGSVINDVSSIATLDLPSETSKTVAIGKLSGIRSELDDVISDSEKQKERVDSIYVPNLSTVEGLEGKIDRIMDESERAENISESADFGLLEESFLSEPIVIEESAIHGEIKYFDYLGAGVLSLIVFFVCLMAPALNIISEKEENTLYRVSTTPASSWTLFMGKFVLFIGFGFIEMIYTLALSVVLFGLRISGSIFDVVVILTLLACASIALGLFISSKVKTMQQALVIVPLIVIPSFLISHAFFPPDIMASYMNYVAYITPMTFSNHALNAIMIKGFSLDKVLIDVFALIAFTLVPLILFIISYKKIKY